MRVLPGAHPALSLYSNLLLRLRISKPPLLVTMGEMGINVGTEHEELAPQDPEKNMDARLPEAAGRDMAELPKGYWTSSFFIGSYCVHSTHPSNFFDE